MACLNFPLCVLNECEENEMATNQDLTTRLDKLEERVANHITFFWGATALGFACMGALALLVYNTRSTVVQVAKAQANVPAQIVASLLSNPATTPSEAQANLAAAASVLKSTKVGKTKPDSVKLEAISDKLLDVQKQYPEMPQVWATTGAFINYKSEALLKNASQISETASPRPCTRAIGFQDGGGMTFTGCIISLEAAAGMMINVTFNGKPGRFIFKNCVVEYSGGALPDGPIIFENSVFRFSVNIVPTRRGTQTMLSIAKADNLNMITIPSA